MGIITQILREKKTLQKNREEKDTESRRTRRKEKRKMPVSDPIGRVARYYVPTHSKYVK